MRVKLNFPEKTHFNITIPVRISDINYGNHVGNDAMVSILHEARVQFLQALGYTELNVEGIGLIMTDLIVEYKQQIYYNTILNISIAVEITSNKGFDLYYKVEKANEVATLAKTGMLCFNYETQKITAMPELFLAKIS